LYLVVDLRIERVGKSWWENRFVGPNEVFDPKVSGPDGLVAYESIERAAYELALVLRDAPLRSLIHAIEMQPTQAARLWLRRGLRELGVPMPTRSQIKAFHRVRLVSAGLIGVPNNPPGLVAQR